MWYLIAQTAVFILIAAVIGFWLGWYLGKMSGQTDLDLLETRLASCRNARKDDKAQVKKLEQQLQEHARQFEVYAGEQARPAAAGDNDLDLLKERLVESAQREEAFAARIKQLEQQSLAQAKKLDACEAARVEQTAELERLQLRMSETKAAVAAPPGAGAQPGVAGSAARANMNIEERRPTTLLSAPEGAPDDLKKIKGVGPRLESLLHELGIFHFHQIAAFTPGDIAWVNERLSFKGRIEREKWVEQAKNFADH